MSFALNRLISGVAAMSVGAAPRSALIARAMSSQAAPVVEIPSNIVFAEEKPMREPRVIPTAQKVTFTSKGDVQINLLSLKSEDELESMTLDGSVFGAPTRVDILQRVVRWQLACRRAGTNKTKTRTEVSGSTRKPWKQKGSGRARVGDIRAPQWRGGYRVHGPKLRDFSYSLPKKVRAMGLRVALSTKLREGKLAIVDSLDVESSKTKDMKQFLESRGWDHALFIDSEEVATNFLLSTRNIPYVDTLPQHKINVYSILQKDLLVITKDAVKYLEERLHTE
ncbi:50S ribosomal protein l4 [Globisporangium polare]